MICPGDPHQRISNAPKFEDRSQEETEWQERCAREAAWRLAKNIFKLKEKDKTIFFSPSENRCLSAPSTLKPEEREFVVDSGAWMQMISKKELNSAELETVTTSRSPTTVFPANGEVQANEEATVYVRELDILLTMKLLEDTPAVLSMGKLCDEHGYSFEWINGKLRTNRGSWFITEFFLQFFPSSTSMTLSRHEIDHPTSSSSSSTSPTMTGIDSYPVTVSSEHVERKER